MALMSIDEPGFVSFGRGGVGFLMLDGKTRVFCLVKNAALDYALPGEERGQIEHLRRFGELREEIEQIASRLFDQGAAEPTVTAEHLPLRSERPKRIDTTYLV